VLEKIQRYESQAADKEAKEQITDIRGHINRAFNAVINAELMYEKDHTQKQEQEDKRTRARISLSDIQKDIKEIKATVTAPGNRMYAQAIANPRPNPLDIEKYQQIERAKKERASLQVTLTYQGADEETKDRIASEHPKTVAQKLQEAVNMAHSTNSPKILGVNKLSGNLIRIQFNNPEDANKVSSSPINWNIAYRGMKPYRRKYGIVIHGVPTEAIQLTTNHEDTKRKWEASNPGLKITHITPLRKQRKTNTPTARRSIIVFTENPHKANNCLKFGFYIDKERLRTEKFAPHLHITQCYRCHSYGHTATKCTGKQACGKCSSHNHPTEECDKEPTGYHCINCKRKACGMAPRVPDP